MRKTISILLYALLSTTMVAAQQTISLPFYWGHTVGHKEVGHIEQSFSIGLNSVMINPAEVPFRLPNISLNAQIAYIIQKCLDQAGINWIEVDGYPNGGSPNDGTSPVFPGEDGGTSPVLPGEDGGGIIFPTAASMVDNINSSDIGPIEPPVNTIFIRFNVKENKSTTTARSVCFCDPIGNPMQITQARAPEVTVPVVPDIPLVRYNSDGENYTFFIPFELGIMKPIDLVLNHNAQASYCDFDVFNESNTINILDSWFRQANLTWLSVIKPITLMSSQPLPEIGPPLPPIAIPSYIVRLNFKVTQNNSEKIRSVTLQDHQTGKTISIFQEEYWEPDTVAVKPNRDKTYVQTKTYNTKRGRYATYQVDYYDKWGRFTESVQPYITPERNSFVTYQEYDSKGRQSKNWLPAVSVSPNGEFMPLESIKNDVTSRYGDTMSYQLPLYESSPLNRIIAQFGPGTDWHNNNKSQKISYLVNSTDINCLKFVITSNKLTNIGRSVYDVNQLSVTRMENEDGHISYEFTNNLGQVIMTRNVVAGNNLDTYYVYNDWGNLAYVLPPMFIDSYSDNDNLLDESVLMKAYAYVYKYDNRKHCIKKRLPGCAWNRYVYDKAGHLILSQDGEQASQNIWLFSIPDAFGRIVLTGTYLNTIADSELGKYLKQAVVATPAYSSVENIGYNISGISLWQSVILSCNYYDSYEFLRGPNFTKFASSAQYDRTKEVDYGTHYSGSKGYLTGTYQKTLGAEQAELFTAIYYDYHGRQIQVRSTNHMGGQDVTCMAYNFTGAPIRSLVEHTVGENTTVELYESTYDYAGRLLTTTLAMNDENPVIISENSYDEVGRLAAVGRAGNPDLTTTYDYNVRSWLTGINSGNVFNQQLYYNQSFDGSTPSWSGNISAMRWQDEITGDQSYKFSYDNLSRLTSADYLGIGNHSTSYSYDPHGNITSLTRGGTTQNFYHTGNQLKSVDNPSLNHYTFNLNGAMTRDSHDGISDIRYNLLNLPERVYFGSFRNDYAYTSQGTKLHVESSVQSAPARDYVDNKIYENGSLRQVQFAGGYYDARLSKYYFYIQDHLGSNRAVVGQDGKLEQRADFYPYGEMISANLNPEFQPFLYSGKEKDFTGLDWYDYGARFLRNARWTTPDPLAEKYHPISPYAYANNNPIRYVDPDGKKWVDANGNAMWQKGQWTKHATPEAMRVGIAMRATKTGVKIFNHVANSPAAIQIGISQDIKIENNGTSLTMGEFIPHDRRVMILENGEMHPISGTIMIYEGSIKAVLNGTIQTSDETTKLVKSLPAGVALNGAIGSVGVHEATHTTPKNIKQQVENTRARENNQPPPHDEEADPIKNQNQYLRELLNK